MAFLSWHERYRLGDADIDAQHQKLFEMVNHFDDVIGMGMPVELGLILEDLVAFTIVHFRFEEDLLKRIGYPQSTDHQKQHGLLLGQVQDMRSRMIAGGHVDAKSIVWFLADWLTNHIIREDMGYKSYLHPHG